MDMLPQALFVVLAIGLGFASTALLARRVATGGLELASLSMLVCTLVVGTYCAALYLSLPEPTTPKLYVGRALGVFGVIMQGLLALMLAAMGSALALWWRR